MANDEPEDTNEYRRADTIFKAPGRIHPAGEEFEQGSPPKHRDKHKASSDVRQPSGRLSTARAHVVDDLARWSVIRRTRTPFRFLFASHLFTPAALYDRYVARGFCAMRRS